MTTVIGKKNYLLGQHSRIYKISDVDWAENEIPNELKEQLNHLREILIDLNNSKEDIRSSSMKWKIIQTFTPERIRTIKDIDTHIRQHNLEPFEYNWINAMEEALELAEHRLRHLMCNSDMDMMTVCLYEKKRDILHEKVHSFLNPNYVNLIFRQWRPFDIKMDKRKNQWLFVLTDSSKYISQTLKHLTERKAYELPRSLEWAFRSMLGDYKDSSDIPLQYEKDYHNWSFRLDGDKPVSDEDMETWFMSCHDI